MRQLMSVAVVCAMASSAFALTCSQDGTPQIKAVDNKPATITVNTNGGKSSLTVGNKSYSVSSTHGGSGHITSNVAYQFPKNANNGDGGLHGVTNKNASFTFTPKHTIPSRTIPGSTIKLGHGQSYTTKAITVPAQTVPAQVNVRVDGIGTGQKQYISQSFTCK